MRPSIGETVVYVDPHAVAHSALVTQVWSDTCINVVFVSSDAAKEDTYGRQIERETSCLHQSTQPAPGRYWRYHSDAPKETERAE